MIVTKTPHRISLFGGGTDIPYFYKKNTYGAVLNFAVDSYVYVSVKKHSITFDERIRLNYFDSQKLDKVEDIKNTIIKEALKFLNIQERIYIGTISDVPAGTGLGSSSSFAVGLLNALYTFKNQQVSKAQLAEEAAHIEIDLLKNPIGKQDQYAAAFGGLNYFKFQENEIVSMNPVIISSQINKVIFENMLTFWTTISRSASDVLLDQKNNFQACQNEEILLKMRDQATEMSLVLQKDNFKIECFGKEIDNAWCLKKKLSNKISNKIIDSAYSLGLENGALGGKLSGAGGGGFLTFFAPKVKHDKIIKSLKPLGLKPYKLNLDINGTRIQKID